MSLLKRIALGATVIGSSLIGGCYTPASSFKFMDLDLSDLENAAQTKPRIELPEGLGTEITPDEDKKYNLGYRLRYGEVYFFRYEGSIHGVKSEIALTQRYSEKEMLDLLSGINDKVGTYIKKNTGWDLQPIRKVDLEGNRVVLPADLGLEIDEEEIDRYDLVGTGVSIIDKEVFFEKKEDSYLRVAYLVGGKLGQIRSIFDSESEFKKHIVRLANKVRSYNEGDRK